MSCKIFALLLLILLLYTSIRLQGIHQNACLFFCLCIQLADFGLAILDGAQNKNNIKLSGTLGYVAPEYLLDGMPWESFYIFTS